MEGGHDHHGMGRLSGWLLFLGWGGVPRPSEEGAGDYLVPCFLFSFVRIPPREPPSDLGVPRSRGVFLVLYRKNTLRVYLPMFLTVSGFGVGSPLGRVLGL